MKNTTGTHRVSWRVWLIVVFALAFLTTVWSQDDGRVTTVIIARHAEKDTASNDPQLSKEGVVRSGVLAHVLHSVQLSAIYSSQFHRTLQTVQPMSDEHHVPVDTVSIGDDKQQYAAEQIRTIFSRHAGSTVFISSHSNVIPLLLEALGIKEPISIRDDEYDNLFVVTKRIQGKPTLLRLKYGKPTP